MNTNNQSQSAGEKDFQNRVDEWLMECFGPKISRDKQERNHRFIEEALELGQSCGATESECKQLVEYVYNRPIGEKYQETGGVMVTLAALCLANGIDMNECGEIELKRIWTKVDKIREKQANKPKHSPLPSTPNQSDEGRPEYIDLQDQVRNHIKQQKLFDWHEALSENEMVYLEDLLLTYAPIFYPGSIGFERTVRPYLNKGQSDELQEARKEIERLKSIVFTKMKEIERLKGVAENAFFYFHLSIHTKDFAWTKFKKENNL